MKFLKFLRKQTERGYEILKFLGARRFSLRTATTEFLNLTPAPSRNGFKILKLIREAPFAPRCALPRVDSAEAGRGCDIVEKRRAVKFNHAGGYLNSARRYIARFCSAAARRGYETGRAGKFSKFSLTSALLNSISLPPRKFKPASNPFLNFISNFNPPAYVAKFERSAR